MERRQADDFVPIIYEGWYPADYNGAGAAFDDTLERFPKFVQAETFHVNELSPQRTGRCDQLGGTSREHLPGQLAGLKVFAPAVRPAGAALS